MRTNSDCEIYSSRILNVSAEVAYQAFADPIHLQEWWGPEGFTNTFHAFNLQPGGKWILTMHGPAKGHYKNSSVFKSVVPNKLVAWTRVSQPLFDMEVEFEQISDTQSEISFRMIFRTPQECEKMKNFVLPNNEENFNRLEKVLLTIVNQQQ